jgi:hypothetical protein
MPKYVDNLDIVWTLDHNYELNRLIGKILKETDKERDGWFECYVILDVTLVDVGNNAKKWKYVALNLRDRISRYFDAYELLLLVRGQATTSLDYKIIPEHEYNNKIRTLYWMAELQSE